MIWSPQLRQTDRQTQGEAKLTYRYRIHHDMVPIAQTDRQTQGEARLTYRYRIHHDMVPTAPTDRQTDTRRGQTHIQV